MFKAISKKNFDDDLWKISIGEICDYCIIEDIINMDKSPSDWCCDKENMTGPPSKKYKVYDNTVDNLTVSYSEKMFHERFIDIREERKLKLDKINDMSI